MLRYSTTDVLKMKPGMRPHPFPGKWPTRILLIFDAKQKRLPYLGKPFSKLVRVLFTPPGVHIFAEFDRKGLVWTRGLNRHITKSNLFNIYHPFLPTSVFFDMDASTFSSILGPAISGCKLEDIPFPVYLSTGYSTAMRETIATQVREKLLLVLQPKKRLPAPTSLPGEFAFKGDF